MTKNSLGYEIKYTTKEEVLNAIENEYPSFIRYASDALLEDRELLLKSMKDSISLSFIGKELRNDKNFIIEAIKINYKVYEYISEDLQGNKEIKKVFDEHKVRLTYEEIQKFQDQAMNSLFIYNCKDYHATNRLKWYS